MKRVAVTGLILFLLLFLLPLLLPGEPLAAPGEGLPVPTGRLPIDHAVVSPPPAGARDADVSVHVAMEDGAVVLMPLDRYLWCVVAAEMPASFPEEALKAQAVAARTYTASKMGHTIQNHPDADVCTDINCCQAFCTQEEALQNWGERAGEYTEKITQAVSQTDGKIAVYDGAPIQAVFFSSAAGKTVDAVEVWGSEVPYLSSVDTPEGEEVPGYHSTVNVPVDQFKRALSDRYPDLNLEGDPSGWFGAVEPNSAGGVSSVEIGGTAIRGGVLRTLFHLRSTYFIVSADQSNVTFSVTGYGHGVGMSQYGASAMAKEGKTWEEIIQWYYSGVTIAQMENFRSSLF